MCSTIPDMHTYMHYILRGLRVLANNCTILKFIAGQWLTQKVQPNPAEYANEFWKQKKESWADYVGVCVMCHFELQLMYQRT